MKTFVNVGNSIDIPAPADLKSDDAVQIGKLFGFAHSDAVTDEIVTVKLVGVYQRDVLSATDIAVGDAIYFDGTDLTTDDASGANAEVGVAMTAGISDGASANVKVKIG